MNYKRLVISLALPHAAGLLGSFFTVSSVSTWYVSLAKPSFNPPNWIFGPVWLLLYTLMGISIYLIWQDIKWYKKKKVKKAWKLFWIHLIFNASWSIIFFGLHSPGLAFVNIVVLWTLIAILMTKFQAINKVATYLLVPYWFWVGFAVVLNFSIWKLN